MTDKRENMESDAVIVSSKRPESFVVENRPVNMLILGPLFPLRQEVMLESISSLAVVKARGKHPEHTGHLTDTDWDEIEAILVIHRAHTGVEGAVQKAKNLKWLHCTSVGVDYLGFPAMLNAPVMVTNGKGVFSRPLAEYALFACNYFAKDFPKLLATKKERRWDMFEVEELRGRTMGIVGLGDIGMRTAKLAKAFRMKVIGIRRNLQLTEEESQIVDRVYGLDELVNVMRMSDYVVVALPLTESTLECINAEALDAMQPHAVFINVGRGKTVDESALIKVLQERQIKGAALDVYYEEPLKPESPIYDLDNVLMSFHNAINTRDIQEACVSRFKELLKEYIDGKELKNLVDLQKGY